MALSKTTQDHDEIRQWAEQHGAIPAEVSSTERRGQVGILRFEFPGAKNANDSALNEISWEDFFEKFDSSGLALVYQEHTAGGEKSNFNKLIHPENAKTSTRRSTNSSGSSAPKKAPAKKSSTKKTGTKTGGKSTRSAAGKKS